MKFSKLLLCGFFIAACIVILAFTLWANTAMGPAPEAFAGLRSDEHVTVSVDRFIQFQPAGKRVTTGFVFYPGGRVDYRSYAVPLRQIAAEGYLVILLPVRLNLAFFDINAADRAIRAFPEIQHWVVGGHSLGGVAAALYAEQQENLDGVVFWASYPANDSLRNSDVKVLSIYGTLDMNGLDRFDASHADLPEDTEFLSIEGGNHAQFGDYGLQPGDNKATITRLEQQKQIVDATVKFLKEVSD
ncbi:MAG TPA: alpha/beta hydrolase [Anaerolineales bacterium]|nr:alpha/beta hydrolase [Anaerolineales bacterium]